MEKNSELVNTLDQGKETDPQLCYSDGVTDMPCHLMS